MKDKRILKIFAGLVALVLIIGILIFTNAFVGNPISSALAKAQSKKYVEKYYSQMDLKLEKPTYNFKDGAYIIKAYSESSKDTHFNIIYRNRDIRDDYEFKVEGKTNTLQRLEDEYTNFVKKLLADTLGYEDNESRVMYEKNVYQIAGGLLELNQEFDINLPLKAYVSINLQLDHVSLEELVKALEDSHEIFLRNDCVFYEYNAMIGSGSKVYNIFGIEPNQIESGNLLEIFEKAIESKSGEYEGISIFVKEI